MTEDRFSRDNLMRLDPDLLRSIIRERTHHTLEHVVYSIMAGKAEPRPDPGRIVRLLLEAWDARGFDADLPDIRWAKTLLKLADTLAGGGKHAIDCEKPRRFSQTEQALVDELLRQRRSIRHWTSEDVPQWMIRKVIEAALWAPHACNLQTLRFIVLDHGSDPKLFSCPEFQGHRAKILVLQDTRAYDFFGVSIPERNRLLDCGAAVQNLLLMAHALGLGAVWSTFTAREIELLNSAFGLPEHLVLRTYVALGWPAQPVIPPGRILVEDAVLSWPGDPPISLQDARR